MINENIRHRNRHTLYLAETGHGKSTCMGKKSGIPGNSARVVLYDPNRDHVAHQFADMGSFLRALGNAHASGRGFRVAYTGRGGPEAFEIICKAVCLILDGRKTTYFVAEEYGGVSPGSGGIPISKYPHHYDIWTQGRKYGLIIHAASQRPQNISKDALENAARIFAGGMGSRAARAIQAETDIQPETLQALTPGRFVVWERGKNHKEIRVF